ncbi:Zn-ribbon domain-containing OB-fold protein [Streptomyces sp. NPDC050287]|uniref:Zn-ribbon domain-containing OB-fold protein n=1 Tax=Streptomyces sp. NPDC050287 TaxID=3365608 RepID=UPI00378ADC0C
MTTQIPARPARRDAASAPWFDGLVRGVLLIRRCTKCGHHCRPDAAGCTACEARDLRWVEADGTAEVVASVATPGKTGVTTVQALVELGEGPWMQAAILGATSPPPPGTALTLTILRPDEGEPIPAFTVRG